MNGGKFFKQTIQDVPLDGKTILLRAGYDLPLDEKGNITNDYRITQSLPTVEELIDRGCKIVMIMHMGRPKGVDPKLSTKVVADKLRELVDVPVAFVDQCVGDRVKMTIKRAERPSITVLENLRFWPGEKECSEELAKQLAESSEADYFVQDAFSNAHRADASMTAITLLLPSVAGLLLEREYVTIKETMAHPKKPLVAVLGGAKADKLSIIEAIIPIAERILIGGALANTFLTVRGVKLGKSKYDADALSGVETIYKEAAAKVGEANVDDFLVLPTDLAVGKTLDDRAKRKNVALDAVGEDDYALDIGDKTIEDFVQKLAQANTVIWNGTLGFAELPEFAHGSARIALALATNRETSSIIGGGDTADFVLHWDSKEGGSFTHVSTGGGASLELMSGKKLPGVESLLDASK